MSDVRPPLLITVLSAHGAGIERQQQHHPRQLCAAAILVGGSLSLRGGIGDKTTRQCGQKNRCNNKPLTLISESTMQQKQKSVLVLSCKNQPPLACPVYHTFNAKDSCHNIGRRQLEGGVGTSHQITRHNNKPPPPVNIMQQNKLVWNQPSNSTNSHNLGVDSGEVQSQL
eukprot:scaffold30998_cov80-Cyclotella_meneghiniana.AAC.6